MNIKAVIFDLDGTLLNTLDDLADSVNELLERYKYPVHAAGKYKKFVGNGAEMLIKRAIPGNLKEMADIKKLTWEFRGIYSDRLIKKTKPYKGIHEMLDALNKKKVPMNVLSNKPDMETNKLVDHFFKKYRFKFVMGSTERFAKKPDPSAALYISEGLKIKPENFAYVGDSDVDMSTAANAGMLPVGVLWGFRDRDELLSGKAQKLLSNPMELIDFLFN